ncbi:MAG: DUF1553 domain-containing protein, partial [Verrucomicrobiae bacterium]|nr:DUF1553 domain-containing protein [Verrucomicrobiae bacterium]
DSAPERLQTTTPLQSLLLVNSEWPLQRAAAFAKRILGEDLALVRGEIANAFRIAYNRPATEAELDLAGQFIETQRVRIAEDASDSTLAAEVKNSPFLSAPKHFAGLEKELGLGNLALHLEEGSRYERLELPAHTFSNDAFTLEAVVRLDQLHEDASVNTIVSQWNGDYQEGGWSIGVTSTRSKYEPRNFIVQLVGENGAGNMEYEVVASGLRVPLNKPVYLTAVVTAFNASEESGGGDVTFYMKDLSDPQAELQTSRVRHSIAARIQSSGTKRILGGRDAERHLWNGEIARLALTDAALSPMQLFFRGSPGGINREDWTFSGTESDEALPEGASWMVPSRLEKAQDPLIGATIDFCHALITSNEFLYLH